jgi:alcohol dehydrogenase YqhD (iron-dependent ADH family)
MLVSFKKSLYDHVQMQLQSQKAGIFAVSYIVPIPTRTNVEKAVVVRFELSPIEFRNTDAAEGTFSTDFSSRL